MDSIRKWFNQTFLKTGRIDNIDAFHKKITLLCCSIFGLPILFGFAFYHFYSQAFIPAILNIILAAVLLLNTLYIVNKPLTITPLRLAVLVLIFFFIGHLNYNISASILYWFFLVPLVSFFFVGLVEGVIWNTLFLFSVAAILTINKSVIEIENLSEPVIARFFFGFLLTAVFSFILEYCRHKFQTELEEKNSKLEKEINDRHHITKSQAQLALAVNQSPATVVITDKDGVIEYVNPIFSETSGYSADEAVGQSPKILQAGKTPRSFYEDLWQTITSGRIWRGEFLNRKKTGEEYWESASISPIFDDDGNIINYVGVKEDISERKKTEAALIKAKEEAEKASQVKSEFLANMSHEIRTPLNAIMGFLSITIEDPDISDIHRQHLSLSHNAAKQLLVLMNDILDLSKLESGQLQLKETDFDFIKMMEDIRNAFIGKIEEKGLELYLKIHPEINRFLHGDAAHIRQVAFNLIDNAVKFTPAGSVSITITPSEDKKFIEFSVKDTGVGIPAEKIQGIFNQFTQVDTGITRRFSGTGLGAAIAKQLVELMGGRIWVKSQVNVGSTFCFTIPLKKAEIQVEAPPAKTDVAAPQEQDGLRILLAEDDETNIILTTIRLEEKGYAVLVARNGNEAVDLFKREPIDIILMDVNMPEKDGIEAAREIRQIEKQTEACGPLPIIALTATENQKEQERILAAGMDRLLGKPIDFDDLFENIEKMASLPGGVCAVPSASDAEKAFETADLPSLEGVHMEKGLCIWQNLDIYLNQLISFAERHRQTPQKLIQFLDEGCYDDIYSVSHTLSGTAANLALDSVASIGRKIKGAAVTKEDEVIQRELENLHQAMIRFSASVQALPPAEQTDDGARPENQGDPALLKELLENLIDAYEEYDPENVEPYLIQLKSYFNDKELKKITTFVHQLDFENAKDATIHFAKQHNIRLKESYE